MPRVRIYLALVLGCCTVFVAGCGGGRPAGPLFQGDEHGVATAVEDLNDAKTQAKKFAASFVAGAAPKDMKAFGPFEFYVAGKPDVSGATAKAKVSVRKQDGTEVGTPEWSFEKDGDKWKIKSAPLP